MFAREAGERRRQKQARRCYSRASLESINCGDTQVVPTGSALAVSMVIMQMSAIFMPFQLNDTPFSQEIPESLKLWFKICLLNYG